MITENKSYHRKGTKLPYTDRVRNKKYIFNGYLEDEAETETLVTNTGHASLSSRNKKQSEEQPTTLSYADTRGETSRLAKKLKSTPLGMFVV